MYVNPGEFRKRISFIEYVIEVDSSGHQKKQPTKIYSCNAKFSRTSGTESIRLGSEFSEVDVRFLIRYTKVPISRKNVILYGGKKYEIEYINDYGDEHRYIEIIAKLMERGG